MRLFILVSFIRARLSRIFYLLTPILYSLYTIFSFSSLIAPLSNFRLKTILGLPYIVYIPNLKSERSLLLPTYLEIVFLNLSISSLEVVLIKSSLREGFYSYITLLYTVLGAIYKRPRDYSLK